MKQPRFDRILSARNRRTTYRDGDRTIKVFGAEYSKSYVLSAALTQSRIEETGLPIPHLLEVASIDGKWAIASEYIRGQTLDVLLAEHPERRAEYLSLFVDLQMQVHRQSCPYLDKLKDTLTGKIIRCELDAQTRFNLYTRLEEMPRHSKTCHGDFVPSNVVIAEDGKPYILDWSNATRGNASADVAITYLRFCLDGKTDIASEYLRLFCEKSDTPKGYVGQWIPIIAAALSVGASDADCEYLFSRITRTYTDF